MCFSQPRALGAMVNTPRATRSAALLAVLAMAGVFAVTATLLARDLGAVFFAFVFVFVLAFSGWFVLTRRRLGRLLGSLGVLLGIAGLVGFVEEQSLFL